MVIGCEGYEDNLGTSREVVRAEATIQFPPFFGSDSAAPQEDPARLSTIFHEEGGCLGDFNAAQDEFV